MILATVRLVPRDGGDKISTPPVSPDPGTISVSICVDSVNTKTVIS